MAIDLLLKDYQLTINQVFESYNPEDEFYQTNDLLLRHNDWLFLQFHKYKDHSKIKKILTKLAKDWLVYNKDSLLDKLPNETRMGNKYDLFKKINYDLNIFWKISEFNKQVLAHPVLYSPTREDKVVSKKNRKFVEEKIKSYQANMENK
jgi:hypothetical protein